MDKGKPVLAGEPPVVRDSTFPVLEADHTFDRRTLFPCNRCIDDAGFRDGATDDGKVLPVELSAGHLVI